MVLAFPEINFFICLLRGLSKNLHKINEKQDTHECTRNHYAYMANFNR